MNFTPDSDSSGDSPVHHNVSIRLSDIGKIDMYGNAKSSRFEIDSQTKENKSQLNAALRRIDGTPGHLERAIDLEQRKSIFGKTSLQQSTGGKSKRAPPRPPVIRNVEVASEESAVNVLQEHRAPPVPPRPKQVSSHVPVRRALEFNPVDYATITSPDSIEKTR